MGPYKVQLKALSFPLFADVLGCSNYPLLALLDMLPVHLSSQIRVGHSCAHKAGLDVLMRRINLGLELLELSLFFQYCALP